MAINPKQAIFARLVASGETAVSAYALAYPKAKKTSVRAAAARLAHHPGVRAEIARLQEAAGKEAVLSIIEKRKWLKEFVNMPLSDTVKASDKIRAIEVDNKMAGHEFKDQPAGKGNPFLMLVGLCGNSRDDDETTTIEAEVFNS